ncbi:MAG TPA: TPM domain-containing protein [Xanthobacteraceae bacterium]
MRSLRQIALALVAVLAVALPAVAQSFPPLSGRVVDDAAVLDAAMRDGIAARLKALEAENSDQLVVATVRSLQGYSVEDYANRLFRAWGLGQQDKNNGVLLLIAPAEHKVRIEVGYGLEGTLTDAVSKLIIENDLIPWLRQNRYDVAASTGVDDIVQVLTGHAAEWQARAAHATSHVHDLGSIELPPALGFVVFGIISLVMLAFAAVVALLALKLILQFLVWIGLLPKPKQRHGGWLWLNFFDPVTHGERGAGALSSGGIWASAASSAADSFSGGGGSSGGGGASGSW